MDSVVAAREGVPVVVEAPGRRRIQITEPQLGSAHLHRKCVFDSHPGGLDRQRGGFRGRALRGEEDRQGGEERGDDRPGHSSDGSLDDQRRLLSLQIDGNCPAVAAAFGTGSAPQRVAAERFGYSNSRASGNEAAEHTEAGLPPPPASLAWTRLGRPSGSWAQAEVLGRPNSRNPQRTSRIPFRHSPKSQGEWSPTESERRDVGHWCSNTRAGQVDIQGDRVSRRQTGERTPSSRLHRSSFRPHGLQSLAIAPVESSSRWRPK